MITQVPACYKYCSTQSMWYDVVNSIPCLVILLTICICAVLAIYIIAKYGVEWYRICKTSKEKKHESSNLTCLIGEDIKKQLEGFIDKEHRLREDYQVLKRTTEEKEKLWQNYVKQLEELYKLQAAKPEDSE